MDFRGKLEEEIFSYPIGILQGQSYYVVTQGKCQLNKFLINMKCTQGHIIYPAAKWRKNLDQMEALFLEIFTVSCCCVIFYGVTSFTDQS